MSRAVKVKLKCKQKTIFITWKVLITGALANRKRARALIRQFRKSFNNNKKYFKIGDCKVIFKLKAKWRKNGTWFPSDLRKRKRDLIVIEGRRANGGGAGVAGNRSRRGFVLIHPRSDNGELQPWKTENELGHGLGLVDRGRGVRGEWNFDGVKPHDIAKIFNANASGKQKRRLKECCNTTIDKAMTPPGIHIEIVPADKQKGTPKKSAPKDE